MTSPKSIEVGVLSAARRRRWAAAENVAMARETYEPGMTVSLARQRVINPNPLFHWRKGALPAVGTGETVVTAAQLEAARRQIRELP
jgi:transposase